MKHTPGPWTVDDSIDSNGFFYYVLDGPKDINGAEESKANCRLIAAAPDLLAELKHARAIYAIIAAREASPITKQVLKRVDALIAKAED